MTGLLVSVRSPEEADAAFRAGADLIDVKEPRAGSLGAARPWVIQQIATRLSHQVPLSSALGELLDDPSPTPCDYLAGYAFAKLGLAGCGSRQDWPERWSERLARLPAGVVPVAVAYADWGHAGAPPPETVIERAAERTCAVVLFDTFDKRHGDLFQHVTDAQLCRWIGLIRRHRMRVVLGGSLRPATLSRALSFAPDYVAVRGAVCRGGRESKLDETLVCDLSLRISEEIKGDKTSCRHDPATFA